jgi:hypothetical protein
MPIRACYLNIINLRSGWGLLNHIDRISPRIEISNLIFSKSTIASFEKKRPMHQRRTTAFDASRRKMNRQLADQYRTLN